MTSSLIDFAPSECWLVLGFCLFLYWISPITQGVRSVTHMMLFDKLTVLNPTEQSVATIAGIPGSRATVGVSKPKTKADRLAALELTSRKLQTGMVAVAAMKKKEGHTAKLWRMLEALCVLVIGCLLALSLRWSLLFWKSVRSPCCHAEDIACWDILFDQLHRSIPWVALLILWTIRSIVQICFLTSQLPPTSPLRYPPAAYVTGWVMGLSALWLANTPKLLAALEIPLPNSNDELAVRITLWCRVLGVRVEDEEALVESLSECTKWAISFAIGYISFALSDPLATTAKLIVYRFIAGMLANDKGERNSNTGAPNYQVLVALALLAVLPAAMMTSYFTNPSSVRIFLGWLFVASVLFVVKPLLQTHLEQALPAVSRIFDGNNKDVTAEAVQFPFQGRQDRLVPVAGQLVAFPFWIIALLALRHLCPPTTAPVYPGTFGGDLFERSKRSLYRGSQVTRIVMETGNNDTSIISSIVSPVKASLCGTNGQQQQKGSKNQKRQMKDIESAFDLLENAPVLETSLAGELGKLQSSLKKRKEQSHRENSNNRQPAKETKVKSLVVAVWDHPLMTPTIVRPVVEFGLLLLCLLWTFSLFTASLSYGKIRTELGAFSYSVERDEKND